MSYSIQWKEKGLYRKFSGTVTGQDIFESAQKTQTDPRFRELHYILNDFTDTSDLVVNQADIAMIAAVGRIAIANNPDIIGANVVNDDNAFMLAEAYREKMTDHFRECRSFTDLDEAWKWITEFDQD